MIGAIRTWDILSHPVATIRCFGWRVFFRASFAGGELTFLSLLKKANVFGAAPSPVPELLDRCIALELRARQIYAAFAQAFTQTPPIRVFFAALARQEQEHADLLEVCRFAAAGGRWQAGCFHPWQQWLPRLEQQMQEAEAAVYSIGSVAEALALAVQIESSEINQVFAAVLRASDAPFVKKLRPFREAINSHIGYLCRRIPQLAPVMTAACRELQAKFPGAE